MAMTEALSVIDFDKNMSINSANLYMVPGLIDFYKQLWWDTGTHFPIFSLSYSHDTQKVNEKKIDKETT